MEYRKERRNDSPKVEEWWKASLTLGGSRAARSAERAAAAEGGRVGDACSDVLERSVVGVLGIEMAIVGARCGIGRGRRFKSTLGQIGLNVIPSRSKGIDWGVGEEEGVIRGS